MNKPCGKIIEYHWGSPIKCGDLVGLKMELCSECQPENNHSHPEEYGQRQAVESSQPLGFSGSDTNHSHHTNC